MSSETDDTKVQRGGRQRYFAGMAVLVGGAIAVVLAMAGWLYFLGWLTWRLLVWILGFERSC